MKSAQMIASRIDTTEPDDRPVPERLLAAALKLVQNHGLQAMSQARVAAAAGLRQSHLTYYFPTRKDLIKALVITIHTEIKEALDTATPVDRSQGITVEKARNFFAERIKDPILSRLMLALMNAVDEDPSLAHWITEFDAELITRLRQVFLDLGLKPSNDDIALLHASFIGIATMNAIDDSISSKARTTRLACLAFDRTVENARPLSSDDQAK
jgi:AcrR family transcriptional regulator